MQAVHGADGGAQRGAGSGRGAGRRGRGREAGAGAAQRGQAARGVQRAGARVLWCYLHIHDRHRSLLLSTRQPDSVEHIIVSSISRQPW